MEKKVGKTSTAMLYKQERMYNNDRTFNTFGIYWSTKNAKAVKFNIKTEAL